MNQTIPNRRRSTIRSRILVFFMLLVGLAGTGVIGLVLTLAFGTIAGEEFSPQQFTRRSFVYYQVPLLGLQVTPISREDTTNSLESHLKGNGYLPSGGNPTPRWDLVFAVHGGGDSVYGDASILCEYLDAVDEEGTLLWLSWTEDHPELAKSLWPEVTRLARGKLYMFVPPLLDAANSASTAEELSAAIRREIVRQYEELADIQRRRGQHEKAAELLEQARQYD